MWAVHSDLPLGWGYTFKWATIPTKCCHLSTGGRPGFHLSVAWEAEGVLGERERERTRERKRERRLATPLVTLWFVAQHSQAASHSSITFFPLLQLSANSDLLWTSPDTSNLQSPMICRSNNSSNNIKGRVQNSYLMYSRKSNFLATLYCDKPTG